MDVLFMGCCIECFLFLMFTLDRHDIQVKLYI